MTDYQSLEDQEHDNFDRALMIGLRRLAVIALLASGVIGYLLTVIA